MGTGLVDRAIEAQRGGRPDEAEALCRRAIAAGEQPARARFALGNLLRQRHRLDEAIAAYREALEHEAAFPFCHYNLGISLEERGFPGAAMTSYRNALALAPGMTRAHYRLARLQHLAGEPDVAEAGFGRAIRQRPDFALAHAGRGTALRDLGRYEEAVAAFEQAIRLQPDHAEAHHDLGTTLQLQGRLPEAMACYRRAVTLEPNYISACTNLGSAAYQLGDIDTAQTEYANAIRLDAGFPQARLGFALGRLPVVYDSKDQMARVRKTYAEHLKRLIAYYADADEATLRAAADAVGLIQPFLLAYQGLNDRALQHRYGEFIVRLMAARYPQWSLPLAMPALHDGERLRVGFVSGFFRNHSNWKIPLRGWVENLDRRRFELFGYYTVAQQDTFTAQAGAAFDHFVQGPLPIARWCERIRADDLHVLVFPETGMDPSTVQLACLRLAPLQGTSWGHPDTSGLPTLDFFLSSDLMEPEDGPAHYTEELVRLPNLSVYYTPLEIEPRKKTKSGLGLPADCVLYWCCQSIFKYLPQHDDLLPRIAGEVPAARFLFIEHGCEAVAKKFRDRLRVAFEAHGLDWATHCRLLPRMDSEDFAGVTAIADVFLDSVGWSGCNSTLEALAENVPVVTRPGDTMRSRHTLAILQMMGMEELIAASADEYVALAVRLGTDPAFRGDVAERIAACKQRLYGDLSPVRAVEDFLQQAVAGYAAGGKRREDDGVRFMAAGRHFQDNGQLDKAAAAFREGLRRVNPDYAEANGVAAPVPAGRPPPAAGTTKTGAYHYPAIAPVPEDTHRPFWSVVIPAYRRREFLLECLASVLAQWHGSDDMEIVVVDNGSAPALQDLVESIGGGIVRYYRHDETIPLQDNWNSAVAMSRGRWVHLLHDDDYVLPGFYSRLRDGLQGCPDTVGAAFCAYRNIEPGRAVVFSQQPYGGYRGIADDWLSKIGIGNVLNPPAVVIRRDAYERVGGYSPDILYTTDWELYLRVASFYDWWCEPETLVHYRQHPQNVTAEQDAAGAQGEAFRKAIEMATTYLPADRQAAITAAARERAFLWCLQRVAVPLRSGNVAGALRLVQEALRIRRSDASVRTLFDLLLADGATALRAELATRCPSLASDLPGSGQVASGPAAFRAVMDDERSREALVDELLALPAGTADSLSFSRTGAG